jgi:hypothetical protein
MAASIAAPNRSVTRLAFGQCPTHPFAVNQLVRDDLWLGAECRSVAHSEFEQAGQEMPIVVLGADRRQCTAGIVDDMLGGELAQRGGGQRAEDRVGIVHRRGIDAGRARYGGKDGINALDRGFEGVV